MFEISAELPSLTPAVSLAGDRQENVSEFLSSVSADLAVYAVVAKRFAAVGWTVTMQDDDSLPFLTLTAPESMDKVAALNEAHTLAGAYAPFFYGLNEI